MKRTAFAAAGTLCIATALGALAMGTFVALELFLEYGHNTGFWQNAVQIASIVGAALVLVTLPFGIAGIYLWRSALRSGGRDNSP